MSVGSRIRRVRKFRDMTQKELGIALGYDEKSADVRITQYETGTRTPKIDVLNAMAEVLNVNILALREPDTKLYAAEDIMSILFELDDEGGLNLFDVEDDSDPDLPETRIGVVIKYRILQNFLKEWQLRKQELKDGLITKDEYTEWKINWPSSADEGGKYTPNAQWKNNK